MPSSKSPAKSPKIGPSAQQTAVRQQRLLRGISALHVALDCLPLASAQRLLVESLINEQERLLAATTTPKQPFPKPRQVVAKQAPTSAKVPKMPLSREEQQRRTVEGQLKKQKRDDRDKRVQMIEAKNRAEIEAVHRKSGYSSFIRRVPGFFEGGKK